MDKIKRKHLTVKKFGWKRIAKNTIRFGYHNTDNIQETTITEKTEYEGNIVGNKIYITPNTTTKKSVLMHLYFYRNSDEYPNLSKIFLLEILYNIIFFFRRILGWLLPIATTVLVILGAIMVIANSNTDSSLDVLANALMGYAAAILVWIVFIVLENILARISAKILGIKVR